MKEWAHNVRELGNDSVHPKPDQPATGPKDARDIVRIFGLLSRISVLLTKKFKTTERGANQNNLITHASEYAFNKSHLPLIGQAVYSSTVSVCEDFTLTCLTAPADADYYCVGWTDLFAVAAVDAIGRAVRQALAI
jgi:hypothetical protein